MILSIFVLAQAASGNIVRWYVSIEDRTVLTKLAYLLYLTTCLSNLAAYGPFVRILCVVVAPDSGTCRIL